MLYKQKVIDTIQQMPDKFDFDDLLDRIIFLQKIEEGFQQSINDEVIPDNLVEEKLPEWLK